MNWYPDTCQCVINYGFDTFPDGTTGNYKNFNVVNKCAVHLSVPDNELHLVLGFSEDSEHQTKAAIVRELLKEDTISEDSSGRRKFKAGIEVGFEFSGSGRSRSISKIIFKQKIDEDNFVFLSDLPPAARTRIKEAIRTISEKQFRRLAF